MTQFRKPESPQQLLEHHGIKGMHWGVRKDNLPGVSAKTNNEAKKDAEEFTRAKLFYGQGAGTRRKLIKNTVEAKSAKDPNYKRAFDHHVANTDLSKRAEQARSERRRKDTKANVGKTVRGTRHVLNGNSQYASATVALAVGGALYAHRAGVDKVLLNAFKKNFSDMGKSNVQRGADILRNAGFNI